MHNPFKNPERYTMIGDVSTQVARRMAEPEVERFFWRLIQRLVCKSDAQCKGALRIMPFRGVGSST